MRNKKESEIYGQQLWDTVKSICLSRMVTFIFVGTTEINS